MKDYYDFTPALENIAGDIWSGLPTFGLLGSQPLAGIVITPACDLSNRKVETITYLPIIPVRSYFATPAFVPDIIREIQGQLQAAQATDMLSLLDTPVRFRPPSNDILEKLETELTAITTKPRTNDKVKNAIRRAIAGISLLRHAAKPEVINPPIEDLTWLLGEKQFKSMLERIVTNSFRLDVYFLPSDEQDIEWSGIIEHSLVLFRYALSAPVDLFEYAQDLLLNNWDAVLRDLAAFVPGAVAFSAVRPMKRLTLRPRFLSDLLTRYVAMHVRLGSPDFTSQTVSHYVSQIGEC